MGVAVDYLLSRKMTAFDYDALLRLVDYQLQNGTDFFMRVGNHG